MPFIRKLSSADLPALKAHHARLDGDDRYLRFGHHVSDTALHRYLDAIAWADAILMGHFEAGRLRAVVEIVPLNDGWERAAELALTVETPWRGRGLGTELCRRALVLACNRRIREVAMICLAENVRMQRLAAKLDARVVHRAGEVEGRVILPRPSPWSLLQEAVITSGALAAGLLEPSEPGATRPGERAPDCPVP